MRWTAARAVVTIQGKFRPKIDLLCIRLKCYCHSNRECMVILSIRQATSLSVAQQRTV